MKCPYCGRNIEPLNKEITLNELSEWDSLLCGVSTAEAILKPENIYKLHLPPEEIYSFIRAAIDQKAEHLFLLKTFRDVLAEKYDFDADNIEMIGTHIYIHKD